MFFPAGLPGDEYLTAIGRIVGLSNKCPESVFDDFCLPHIQSVYTGRVSLTNPQEQMNAAEKEKLAEEVVDRWVAFQMALSNKRKYPTEEFTAFSASVRGYVRVVGRDPLIHREVATAINGLVDFLKVERRLVPDAVIYEASRLESLLFSGYDPHFEGDEPPGL